MILHRQRPEPPNDSSSSEDTTWGYPPASSSRVTFHPTAFEQGISKRRKRIRNYHHGTTRTQRKRRQGCISFWLCGTVVLAIVWILVVVVVVLLSWWDEDHDVKSRYNNRMDLVPKGSAPSLVDSVVFLPKQDSESLLYSPGNRHRSISQGTQPLRLLLEKAGYILDPDKNGESLQSLSLLLNNTPLPTWEDIVELYGPKPVLFGMKESCQAFRQRPNPAEHYISVAGTFNSGTNLMAQLLWSNCYMRERVKKYGWTSRGIRWQVPYGKHTPVDNETIRQHHKAGYEQDIVTDNVLPIVTIRDPYYWMQSMCRHPYQMQLFFSPDGRCPYLVPDNTKNDSNGSIFKNIPSIPVRVHYGVQNPDGGFQKTHDSLVHHYNEWYGAYLNASWPRVVVRYEDLIFWPQQVTRAVCECAGGRLLGNFLENGGEPPLLNDATTDNDDDDDDDDDDEQHQDPAVPFHYPKESAKEGPFHGNDRTDLVQAMLQYRLRRRHANMTANDLRFAQQHLDPRILKLFHYSTIPSPSPSPHS